MNLNIDLDIPIVPFEQFSHSIKLCFNGYNSGYTKIILYNIDTRNRSVVRNVKDKLRYDEVLKLYYLQVDNIDKGIYSVYAADDSEKILSNSVSIIVSGDSKKEIFDTVINFAIGSDSEYINIYNDIKDQITEETDMIQLLFQAYSKCTEKKKIEQRYCYAKMLSVLIDLYNYKQKSYHLLSDDFAINTEDKSFKLPPEINKVLRINLFNDDNIVPYEYVDSNNSIEDYSLQTKENSVYVYKLLDNTNTMVGIYYFFEPSFEFYNRMKNDKIKTNNEYTLAIERNIDYPSSYLKFSDEEKLFLSVSERIKSNCAFIFPPIISVNGNMVTAEIRDYQTLLDCNKEFYLVFQLPEECFEQMYKYRIKITAEIINFDIRSKYIDQTLHLCWIEDADGIKVSNIVSADCSGNNITADFNEKIRLLKLYEYNKHFAPYILNKYEDKSSTFFDVYKKCEVDTEVDSTNLYIKMLDTIIESTSNISEIEDYIKAIMEDKTVYGKYRIEFLKEKIRYKYKQNTVIIPTMENCMCIFEEYSMYKTPVIQRKITSSKTATEIRFDNCQFCVIRLMDLSSYTMSGFILIDFTKSDLRPHVYKFLIESEEVIN